MVMRDWGFLASSDDLEAVSAAAKLYRDHCAPLQLPTRAAFDGSIDDAHTLDYLGYEGISPRGTGIESAALVCGEVLRRALGLEWVISYRGDWFVASSDEATWNIAICPLARLHELECGGRARGCMYTWFVEEAAFDCLLRVAGEEERKARELIEPGGSYLTYLERALERLRKDEPKKRRQ